MTCRDAEQYLAQLAFDELDPSLRDELDEHLAACPACARLRGDFEQVAKALAQGLAADQAPTLSHAAREQLFGKAQDEARRYARPPLLRLPLNYWLRYVSVAAAALVLTLGLAGLWFLKDGGYGLRRWVKAEPARTVPVSAGGTRAPASAAAEAQPAPHAEVAAAPDQPVAQRTALALPHARPAPTAAMAPVPPPAALEPAPKPAARPEPGEQRVARASAIKSETTVQLSGERAAAPGGGGGMGAGMGMPGAGPGVPASGGGGMGAMPGADGGGVTWAMPGRPTAGGTGAGAGMTGPGAAPTTDRKAGATLGQALADAEAPARDTDGVIRLGTDFSTRLAHEDRTADSATPAAKVGKAELTDNYHRFAARPAAGARPEPAATSKADGRGGDNEAGAAVADYLSFSGRAQAPAAPPSPARPGAKAPVRIGFLQQADHATLTSERLADGKPVESAAAPEVGRTDLAFAFERLDATVRAGEVGGTPRPERVRRRTLELRPQAAAKEAEVDGSLSLRPAEKPEAVAQLKMQALDERRDVLAEMANFRQPAKGLAAAQPAAHVAPEREPVTLAKELADRQEVKTKLARPEPDAAPAEHAAASAPGARVPGLQQVVTAPGVVVVDDAAVEGRQLRESVIADLPAAAAEPERAVASPAALAPPVAAATPAPAAAPEAESEIAPVFQALPVNPFVLTEKDRFSTFALDVDTASYSVVRDFLLRQGALPPPEAVRMEEFVNAFDYNYPRQAGGVFNVHVEGAPSPFRAGLSLLKIGIAGKVLGREGRKPAHLVFVIDASGSMATPTRMPLIQYALNLLVGQLGAADRVSLVTFGAGARLVLEAAPVKDQDPILQALAGIRCAGSTNLLAGLELGYALAQRAFRAGEINRVILCSDGVANVGATEADEMLQKVQAYRDQGTTFTSVGFGSGSYNDVLLEKLADRGDGSYVFVDSEDEARRVFVEQLAATLQTIAKDAKVQVEFNPARVRRYRLIGYENRDVADQDFRNDAIDAGEVGSGQSATALYELELLPAAPAETRPADLGTVFVRYRDLDTNRVEEISARLASASVRPRTPADSPRFFLAACAAEFAEILRRSEAVAGSDLRRVAALLTQTTAALPLDQRAAELLQLVRRARELTPRR